MTHFYNFGHDLFDAYMNMAIDSALFQYIQDHKDPENIFIRTYDFTKPAFILGVRESMNDVRIEMIEYYDITRRESGGCVILCDTNTLAYSIVGPKKIMKDYTTFHKRIGGAFGYELKKMGFNNISLGQDYSIRIDGLPVIGNAYYDNPYAMLYHGVIAIDNWDTEKIYKTITEMQIDKKEFERVLQLKSLRYYNPQISKESILAKIPHIVSNGSLLEIEPEFKKSILEDAKKIAENKYKNMEWIKYGKYHDDSKLEKGQGFCFCDVREPEKIMLYID